MVLDDFVSTKAGVYQFYVYPLGKYYIGESVNIRRRVKEHLTKGGNIDIPYSTISHNLLKTHRSRNFEWSYVND